MQLKKPKKVDSVRKVRRDIKFDMYSMAACLGIPKSTYQRYEDGSAKTPPEIMRAALELRQINETFITGLPGRVDARIEEDKKKKGRVKWVASENATSR